MSLDLYVDGDRWRRHLRGVVDGAPGLVPVAKGNGYGFGLGSLARRTQWLGCDTIAVGTYREVPDVASRYDGDIVVLEPWRPFSEDVAYGKRIVHTVGRLSDLADLAARDDVPRVVLEGLTSMGRFGLTQDELRSVDATPHGVRVEGVALHLPLGSGHEAEVAGWLRVRASHTWFVSHLETSELDRLTRTHSDLRFRARVGTGLWLGDRGALSVRSTVLDAHRVARGDRVGYRQRRIGRAGTVLVVSGGTAHGIGLEAPTGDGSARARGRALALGGLDAVGRALSPYVVAGKQRWFVEPPHMQVSLIHLPDGELVPAVGERIEVEVRFTTTHFDHVVIS